MIKFNTKLKEKLIKFNDITKKIIECLQNEEIHKINDYLIQRQNLINDINNIDYEKEDFRDLCNELNCIQFDCELKNYAVKKRYELKNKLTKIKVNDSANKTYNKNLLKHKNFFSTKI